MSYYNAGQITLRHPTSHGLQLDFSYTFSNSIDFGSDTERSNEFGTNSTNTGSFSEILNTWKPYLNRGVSDFDTRHLITVDWVYQLALWPRKSDSPAAPMALADAIIGGWQLSGINRWSSGLPFSLYEPGWTTDWQIESFGVVTQPVKMRTPLRLRTETRNSSTIPMPSTTASLPEGRSACPIQVKRDSATTSAAMATSTSTPDWTRAGRFANLAASNSPGKSTTSPTPCASIPPSIGSGLTGGNLGVASSLAHCSAPHAVQPALRFLDWA